jgi:hypothetical protein
VDSALILKLFTLWLLVMTLYRLIEVSTTPIVQDVLRATKRIFQLTATIKSRNLSTRISSPKSKCRIRNDLDLVRSCTRQWHKTLTPNPL